VWNVLNITPAEHEALTRARDALVKIMERNWVSEHHMDIGRAYHAVAKLAGYSQEALQGG
jgi:hypothetical protein